MECHFWGNGLAAMSSEFIVYVAEVICPLETCPCAVLANADDHAQGFTPLELVTRGPRLFALRTGLGIERTYTSMALIPPQLTRSRQLEVLLGTSDNSMLVLYEADTKNVIEDQQLQTKIEAPIVKIAVAPNGVFLACYRSDGILTVMTSSFSKKVTDRFCCLNVNHSSLGPLPSL